jgi:hypothetical protein
MQMIIDMNQQLNINTDKMTLLILGVMKSKATKLKNDKNQLIIDSVQTDLWHNVLILN